MGYTSNSKAFTDRLEGAILRGIDRTTASCVAPAKADTPVRTGTAQGSIDFKPAEKTEEGFRGEFGSYNVDYFIWLEIGTRYMLGRHMLQNSADTNFPHVYDNIRAEMRAAGFKTA